jgi:hypothetical protein
MNVELTRTRSAGKNAVFARWPSVRTRVRRVRTEGSAQTRTLFHLGPGYSLARVAWQPHGSGIGGWFWALQRTVAWRERHRRRSQDAAARPGP